MKVVRLSVYLILGVLVLLTLGVILVWPFLRVDQRLRQVISKEIGKSLACSADLQRAHLGFNYLELYGLDVSDPRNRWSVKLSNATVKFNLLNLFHYGFNLNGLLATVQTVDLGLPEVSLCLSKGDSLSKTDTSRFNAWKILDNIPDALLINKVQLRTGVFHLMDPAGKPLVTLGGLDLALFSPQPGVFQGRLSSAKLGSKTLQSTLDLSIDRRARTLEASLYARLETLGLGKEIGLPDSLSLRTDSLNLNLRFWAQDTKTGLDGEIHLGRLAVEGRKQELLNTEPLHLVIGDWKLLIPQVLAHGLAADWKISGEISDLRAPTLDLSIEAHSEDCSKLAALIPEKEGIRPEGKLDLFTTVKGEISRPQIAAKLDLGRLRAKSETLDHLHLDGNYTDNHIVVNELELHTLDGSLSLDGQARLAGAKSTAQAQFRWEGRLPKVPDSRRGVLNGTLSGGEDGILHLDADWSTADALPLQIQGFYSQPAESLRVVVNMAESAARATLIAGSLKNHPVFNLQLDNPQLLAQQVLEWDHWDKLEDVRFTGDFAGPLDRLTCRLQAQQAKAASSVSLSGVLGVKSASWIDFSGDISMQRGKGAPLEGRIAAGWQDGIVTLQSLQLDNAIFAQGSFNTATGEIGSSELRITGWPLWRGMEIFFPQVAAQWGATLDARLEVYGPIKQPTASFNLYASQGTFLEQSGFWAVIAADLQNDTLRLADCNVGRGAISLVKAGGIADLADSTLKLRVMSNLVDISPVLDLFGGNPAKITGPLKVDADVVGTFRNPEMKLQAKMAYGSVYHVPFDSLSASLRFDPATDQALVLNDFHLIQRPDLALEVQGVLPYNNHPLDLQLLFKGNILKVLHQIEPDILVSRGEGELMLGLAQVNGKVQVSSASLDLHNGYLKVPEVVNEIDNLNAKLSFKDNQLLIDHVSGEVEEQRFRLSNSFDDHLYGDLQHLYFAGQNVDLGVLILETFGKGLHVHIPDLMPAGIKGYLSLRGKDGQRYFTASGPIERPLFHGTCNLAGATVTFPFPPGDGRPPSAFVRQVLAVLNASRWDVAVEPARDNRYQHEVKPVDENNLLGGVSNLIASVNIDLTMDVDSKLNVVGSLNQGDFAFIGDLVSTNGTIEYLDLNFRVERFEAEFDQYDLLPWVEGRATTVYADSLGFSHTIYLKLYVVDRTTGERKERGRWGDFVFILEDDIGSSQEQILAALGYSPGTVTSKVTSLGGTILSGMMLRSFIHPVERQLEKYLKMDVIRLQPTIAQHLFESQIAGTDTVGIGPSPKSQIVWGAYFLRQSQLTVGKYLSDDVFLSYNGTWKTALDAMSIRHFGFLHRWNLDYRIRPVSGNLVLTLGYEYDSLEKLEDKRASLRYSFVFR